MENSSSHEYEQAWQQWEADMVLAGRMQRSSSSAVYAHMWSSLARWCVERDIPLAALTPQRLDDYLAIRGGASSLSHRYAWRLLRLVERITSHHNRRQRTRVNTAAADLLSRRPDLRYANAQDADPLPEALDAAQARRLVTHLSALRRAPESGKAPSAAVAPAAWQDLRNRAGVSVQLGAGLTPSEVRALTLPCLLTSPADQHSSSGVIARLCIPADGTTPEREAPLAPWAAQVLAQWVGLRAALAIPGEQVFPSTRSTGKPWGKVAQYDSVRKVFLAAGLDALEGGSFRLRHTFALRQLRRGTPPEQVAQWLGVSDPGVMARYHRAMQASFDVV